VRSLPKLDLNGAPLNDAFPEFWRYVTRQRPRSRPWRDFWQLWTPTTTLLIVVLVVLDIDPLSPPGLAILVAGIAVGMVVNVVLRRLGVIGDYRPGTRGD
jgi:hypothetical protein